MLRTFILAATGAMLAVAGVAQQATDNQSDQSAEPAVQTVEATIQVTATRRPEQVIDLPASVTVITASELEARGARDLGAALALAAGVAIAPGGDGGPASSVPELMGLRELDAFLLVVDGVPWGGAFNPALSTLDLTGVERIELLRGSAPVLFGATSFVGVIHVIHFAPGAAPRQVSAWGGRFGSGATATASFGGSSGLRQSIVASGESQGLADDRAGFDRGHVLWTGAADVGGGTIGFFADLTAVRQDPTSPHPRTGAVLTPLVPLDSNHNPADARIDEDRVHLVANYERPAGSGTWSTVLSYTETTRDTIRGFLREDFDAAEGEDDASGYRQDFEGYDYYLDSHFSWTRGHELSVVTGLDVLGGRGEAVSELFDYGVALDGSDAPPSDGHPIVERPELEDERTFAGAYVQGIWRPSSRWTIDVGLRLNYTEEKQEGEIEGDDGEEMVTDTRDDTRLSGGIGASFLLWGEGADALRLFADYRDAFKPAALDFGPEAEGAILDPETARTAELGLKGSHLEGRLGWQASVFRMDFENLVVARTVDGRPALENAGEQRFEGFEIEGEWRPGADLAVAGSYAWHSAKFRDYVAELDGVPIQLAGHRLEMSPDRLAALGVTYRPSRGLAGYVVGNYVGERYLDKRNTVTAGSYTTLAAGVGYRFGRGEVRIDGTNLTDERPPVSESELGESSYYRLPARSYRVGLTWRF